jgi:hypothetical protein
LNASFRFGLGFGEGMMYSVEGMIYSGEEGMMYSMEEGTMEPAGDTARVVRERVRVGREIPDRPLGIGVRTTNGEVAGDNDRSEGELSFELDLEPNLCIRPRERSEGVRWMKRGFGVRLEVCEEGSGTETVGWWDGDGDGSGGGSGDEDVERVSG